MRAIVALLRLAGILLATVFFIPLALGIRILAVLGAERLVLIGSAEMQALWGRILLRGMNVELDLEGARPAGRYLVVANHLSYVDIPVLAVLFPGRFVAKSEIAGWPFLGFLARLAGTLFVEQARRRDVVRVGQEMERTLAQGVSVVLFPEGGASRGLRVERLHSSLLEAAARGGIPCLPVSLGYETPDDPWAPAATVCWWGGMGFWSHLRDLLALRRIRARVRWPAEPVAGDDRKALARALQEELGRGFRPVRQTPISPSFAWAELFAEDAPEA